MCGLMAPCLGFRFVEPDMDRLVLGSSDFDTTPILT